MATLEELEAQARNAQRRLNNARKRADEKLGKRLRELVAKKRMNREAQDERATLLLDLCADEIKRLAETLDESANATEDERSENDGQEDYGEQYGGSSYA